MIQPQPTLTSIRPELSARPASLTTADILVFSLVAGVLATLRADYVYGLINHIEHIPPIRHMADTSLYASDWHVQESMLFGPRYYYYQLIAFFSELAPLPVVMLVLTILSNVVTLLISFLVARDLFEDDLAALMGCFLIGAVHSIDLGMATFLIWEHLVQASLAEPIAMLALWAGLRLRVTVATVLASISALAHPVVGLETGGLALGIVAVDALFRFRRKLEEPDRRSPLEQLLAALTGLVVLVLIAYGVFLGKMEESIPDQAFFDILVFFRNPHHYVPSQMDSRDWVGFVLFLTTLLLAWRWWRKEKGHDRAVADRVALTIGFVLVLMLAGWLFVEVWPVRTIASMQLYRMIYVIKWIGLLLIGRSVAVWIHQGGLGRWSALIALSGTGMAQPVTAFTAHLAEKIRQRSQLFANFAVVLYVVISAALAVYLWNVHDLREYFYLLLLLGLAAWFVWFPAGLGRRLIPLVLFAVILPLIVVYRDASPVLQKAGVFTLEQAYDQYDEVASYARERLPQDAVFVVPPGGGRFRVVSERAIVVDFKSFVFQDSSIAEWMERMTAVYGETDLSGFPAASALDRKYRTISDTRLDQIAEKYGAGYAVLYPETATSYPVIYEDHFFKLVRLSPGS